MVKVHQIEFDILVLGCCIEVLILLVCEFNVNKAIGLNTRFLSYLEANSSITRPRYKLETLLMPSMECYHLVTQCN